MTPEKPREQVRSHAKHPRPKTKVNQMRCKCKKKIHDHSHWVGGVDPMNIVIVSSIVAVPALGAGVVLVAFLIVALILIIILL